MEQIKQDRIREREERIKDRRKKKSIAKKVPVRNKEHSDVRS